MRNRGVEDPRIVKIDDLYYLFYTAYDGKNSAHCFCYKHGFDAF